MDNYSAPLILFIVGSVLLFVSSYFRKKKKRLISTGVAADGIVYDFESAAGWGIQGSGTSPVIRFLTEKNVWVTKVYYISYPSFVLKKGSKVQVYYDPGNPTDFVLNLAFDKWLVKLFTGGGLLSIAIGVFLILINLV